MRVMQLWDAYKEDTRNGLTEAQFVVVMLQVLPKDMNMDRRAYFHLCRGAVGP